MDKPSEGSVNKVAQPQDRSQSVHSGILEDVFSIPEGRIVFQYHSPLSADSIQDVKDWLDIVKRKISRCNRTEASK